MKYHLHILINASWIHIPIERAFISAQAPLRNTIDDFWTMCFDYNITTVIMLCQLKEKGKEKCVEYWDPEKKDDIFTSTTDNYEYNFKITYTSEEINEDITIRTCHVLNKTTNEEKEYIMVDGLIMKHLKICKLFMEIYYLCLTLLII